MPRLTAHQLSIPEIVGEVCLHDHICLIYETKEEQLAAVVPFFRIGLERGERCVYIADESTASEISEALKADGIDVDGAIASEALIIAGKRDAYLREGFFDPDSMIGFLKEAVDSAKASGFKALRATGEMTWALGDDPGVERLIEYEAKLNYFFPENDIVAICQYDRNRFSPDIIKDVIHTHPLVIYGGVVCKNTNYVPPEELLSADKQSLEVERHLKTMLEREEFIKELQAGKEELEKVVSQLKQEVVERKQAEKSLLASMRDLSKTQEVARLGTWGWDMLADKITWSDNLYRIFGIDPEETRLSFDVFVDRVHPDDREYINELVAEWIKNRRGGSFEYRVLRPDGSVKYILGEGEVECDEAGKPVRMFGILQDISKQRRTEIAIRESELWLRSVFGSLEEAVLVVSPDRTFVRVNKAAEKMYGYSEEELKGLSTEVFHVNREHYLEFGKKIREAFDNEQAANFEFVAKRKSGEIFPTEHTVALLKDDAGEPLGIVSVVRDITERKRVEEVLKKQTHLNQAFLDAIPGVALLLNSNREIILSNKAGLEAGAVPCKQCFSTWGQREDPCNWCLGAKALETGEAQHIVVEAFGIVWDAYWIPLGQDLYMHYAFDITERKRAEDELRGTRQYLSSMIEGSTDAIIATDQDGNIALFNPGAEALLGYRNDEVLGQYVSVLYEDVSEAKKVMRQMRQNDGVVTNFEVNKRAKDGSLIPVWISACLIYDETGKEVGTVGFSKDLRERKQAEERIRKLSQAVEQSPSVVVIADTEGTIEYVNPKFTELTGYTPEEALGQNPRMLKSDEHPSEFYNELWSTITSGKEWRGEFCNKKKNGELYWEYAVISPIRNEAGEVSHFVAVKEDITGRKQAEERIRRLNQTFLKLGHDADVNIQYLTEACGELLRAACALYNRMDKGLLVSVGQWQTPEDYSPVDRPEGHICYDVINRSDNGDVYIVKNLDKTRYYETDPNVKRYGLKTYMGHAVHCFGERVGSLCVVYQDDVVLDEEDERTLKVLARAIGIEEQRKEAEEALRQSEERFRSLSGHSQEGILAYDKDIRFIFWNTAMERITGINSEELIGKSPFEVFPFLDEVGEGDAMRDAVKGRATVKSEMQYDVPQTGRKGFFESSHFPVSDAQGNIIGGMGVIRDITESKRAEQALRQSEAKYRILFEGSRDAIYITSVEGDFVEANDATLDLFGYSKDELADLKAFDVYVDPEDRTMFQQVMNREGFVRDYELKFKKKDGSLMDCLVTSTLRKAEDGTILGYHGIIRDVTERKKAEKAVEETRTFYEGLVGEAGDAIVVLDREGTVLNWNKGAEHIFGWSSEEIVGRSYMEFNLTEDKGEIWDRLKRILTGNTLREEIRRQRKDGTFFDGLLTASPVHNMDGDIIAAQAIIKDITEIKQGGEELQRAHEELQRAYDDLARAQATALSAEKLAAVGRLTAGVSHEILNPLNAITISLHLMINDEETSPALVDDLKELMDQARRITKISQDLLYFSRQRPPERTVVDVEDTVERTIGLLAHELRLGNIAVEKKFAEELPKVWADQDQLQQVILNLLTNARDAMPKGGLLVLKTLEAPPLFKSESSSIELRVEDSGPGIDPEKMGKIFEPFFTTKEEGKGTGMGLSICHGIVETHGGAIWAENLPDGGAAFVVRLPLGHEC